jgi:hypothetical protein
MRGCVEGTLTLCHRELGIGGESFRQDLDRHVPAEAGVLRTIDLAIPRAPIGVTIS